MKPYYSHAGITIYHGDCREILPQLPTGWCSTCSCELADESILAIHLAAGHEISPFVDSVVSDPPYGVGFDTDYTRFTGGRDHLPVAGDGQPFDPTPWLEFDSVVLWGANCYSSRLPLGAWLVWDKRFKNGEAFLADAEAAWMNRGHGIYLFSITSQGFVRPEPIEHPTQKPVAIMEWSIEKAKANNVLDPYMGSGTTLVAAKLLNKRGVGIEIEEKYCEIAAKRLSQEVFQW